MHLTRFSLLPILILALPLFSGTETVNQATWQTYVGNTYQLTLRFPGEWKRDPHYYDRVYFGAERTKYHVARGFFQLDAAEGDSSPEQACKGLAEHVVKPFGEHPTVRQMKVDGQSACLVWPSEDQGAPWDATVVVRYPKPVELEGARYGFLTLDADKDYILAIVQTIRFLSSSRDNSPFDLEIAPQDPKHATAIWNPDASLPVLVTMKNTSSRTAHLMPTSSASEYRAMVMSKSEMVPVKLKIQEVKQVKIDSAPNANRVITLKPQETYQQVLEISFVRENERLGECSLEIERDLPQELGKGIVESNTIKVMATN